MNRHVEKRKRGDGANPVLLVDGDYLTASIAFMLKLKPEFHLEDVLRDGVSGKAAQPG